MLSRCAAERRLQSAAHPGGAVLRDWMGCVHCKHGQGRTALHFAQAFSPRGLETFALLSANRGGLVLLGCTWQLRSVQL